MSTNGGHKKPRVDTLIAWHQEFNEKEFNNKLTDVGMGFTRSRHTDGYFEHYPGTRRKSYIRIANRLWYDEDNLIGTILHEMIHQYQYEVLKRKTSHDAVFNSIARKFERKYKVPVR